MTLYWFEELCGGPETGGGGCGAPLDLYEVDKSDWERHDSKWSYKPFEHRRDEHDLDDNDNNLVKLTFRPCVDCRAD
jgi:hypothetical protein